ncbi:MAG: branched-chain amino acid ABC transporter permease [Alphaproteobacteria bacterium]|nr:branched-chain amino acid ABC transporter permease [Alphaproteobacteria bacterium]
MRTALKTSYVQDIRLFPDVRRALRYAALLALAAALPLLLDDFLLGEATNVLIWAIAGMGLMLLTGHAGQASLGHAAFLAVGCYANAILMERAGLPFAASFLAAGVITGLVGVLVAVPALRLHGIYLAIATLALSILTEDIIVLAEPWTGGVIGLVAPDITIAGAEVDRYGSPGLFYWLCLAVALIVTLGYRNVLRTPLGRAFVAIRDSEISAQAMGINVAMTKALAFGLSCMVTGWAGALMGHFFYTFNHEVFTVIISIQLLVMIVIGGLGSIQGAYWGALVVGIIPQAINIARDGAQAAFGGSIVIPGIETGIFMTLLIVFILFEPRGIHGRIEKWRTYVELFPLCRRDMFRRQKSFLKTERMR